MAGLAERDEILRQVVGRILVDVMHRQRRVEDNLSPPPPSAQHLRVAAGHAPILVPIQDERPHAVEPLGVTSTVTETGVAPARHPSRVRPIRALLRAELLAAAVRGELGTANRTSHRLDRAGGDACVPSAHRGTVHVVPVAGHRLVARRALPSVLDRVVLARAVRTAVELGVGSIPQNLFVLVQRLCELGSAERTVQMHRGSPRLHVALATDGGFLVPQGIPAKMAGPPLGGWRRSRACHHWQDPTPAGIRVPEPRNGVLG